MDKGSTFRMIVAFFLIVSAFLLVGLLAYAAIEPYDIGLSLLQIAIASIFAILLTTFVIRLAEERALKKKPSR